MIDRSRSVGLAGLSAEHDLARRVLEALPPSTRFDALFFDRGSKRLFPMSRPATREAIGALEDEMVPARMQNGTDLVAALRDAGALLRREQSTFAPRTLLLVLTDGALPRRAGRRRARPRARRGARPRAVRGGVRRAPVRRRSAQPRGAAGAERLRGEPARRRAGAAPGEVAEAVTGALADIDRGGDVAAVRAKVGRPPVHAGGRRWRPTRSSPGVMSSAGKPPRAVEIEARGARQAGRVARPARCACAPEWLRAWSATRATAREVAHAGVAGGARAGRADRPARSRSRSRWSGDRWIAW